MDDDIQDDVEASEDVLLRLVAGDISFQQWSAEHLSEIARAAEDEDYDDSPCSSGDEESLISNIPRIVEEARRSHSAGEIF